jgi:hypothetical protein
MSTVFRATTMLERYYTGKASRKISNRLQYEITIYVIGTFLDRI